MTCQHHVYTHIAKVHHHMHAYHQAAFWLVAIGLCNAVSRWFGSDWAPPQGCHREHLPFLASVAAFLSRIAERQLVSDKASPDHASSGSLCYAPT